MMFSLKFRITPFAPFRSTQKVNLSPNGASPVHNSDYFPEKNNHRDDLRIAQELNYHVATPKNRPTAAVNNIARAPQNVTLNAPFTIGAPPAFAAIPPSTARKTSESTATLVLRYKKGTNQAVNNGNAAPNVNVAADEKAA